jgi:hypothetical protein
VGFEPTILVSELPKTHALDRTATGIGTKLHYDDQINEDEVGKACGAHKRDERWKKGFGGKDWM